MRFVMVCTLVVVALQFASGWGDVAVVAAGVLALGSD